MKLIDLSVMIENTPSQPIKVEINRTNHKDGAKKIARETGYRVPGNMLKKIITRIRYRFGKGDIKNTDFPDAEFITQDVITMSTHMGTHIDSPLHFGSTCEGKPSKSIEQMPIDMFYGNGVRLDLRYKKPGELIMPDDIKNALSAIEYELQENDIVLLWTGIEEKWGTKEYFTSAPGMSEEATAYLVEKGIKVMGIDSYGFDRPFGVMINEFIKTKNNKVLWPAHFYGRKREYLHIERLTNLGKLPDAGFKLCCFPLPIKGADASWTRVVAMVDDSK